MEPINQRKLDHINIVSEGGAIDRQQYYFDRIHLTHRALPELNLAKVDPSTKFLGKDLSFPLIISSMTGGADEEFVKINRNLAMAAEAEGVAFAVGSQRIFLSDDADKVKALVKKNKWSCKAVIAPGGIKNPLVQRLGILSADRFPNLVLLRPDGTVSWSMSGLAYQIQGANMASTASYALKANIAVCQIYGSIDNRRIGRPRQHRLRRPTEVSECKEFRVKRVPTRTYQYAIG